MEHVRGPAIGRKVNADKRVAVLGRLAVLAKRRRMTPLATCQAIIDGTPLHPELTRFFAELPDDDRHYWIASLYALLMPKVQRQKLSAYFTPPHLAEYAIKSEFSASVRDAI